MFPLLRDLPVDGENGLCDQEGSMRLKNHGNRIGDLGIREGPHDPDVGNHGRRCKENGIRCIDHGMQAFDHRICDDRTALPKLIVFYSSHSY